jgi:hypothetical protein
VAIALVKDWQMIELEPLGGKGPGTAAAAYAEGARQ